MKYLLLIYTNDDGPVPGTPEHDDYMNGYFEFTRAIMEEGIHLGGHALMGVETASTVAVRDGAVSTTDGPFAETKETLGGYYLVDCDDLDTAIAAAARIPTATHGRIEVRPIMEYPDP